MKVPVLQKGQNIYTDITTDAYRPRDVGFLFELNVVLDKERKITFKDRLDF